MSMKKFLIIFLIFLFCNSCYAQDIKKIKYKNLKDNAKITTDGNIWTKKVNKKNDYYIKKSSLRTSNFSEFYFKTGEMAFSTATQYEFLHKGALIGYSEIDLKFYEFRIENGILEQRELSEEEIKELFPNFRIIKISEFSPYTDSLKIKKEGRKSLKLILLNDTPQSFYYYKFSTNNSKFNIYPFLGFIEIKKKGMIEFSHYDDITGKVPHYILLIR